MLIMPPPLYKSTVLFDLLPDAVDDLGRPRISPMRKSKRLTDKVRRAWELMGIDIVFSMARLGIPRKTIALDGSPMIISLSDWGDIRLVHDCHGARVLIRACSPVLIGSAVPLWSSPGKIDCSEVMRRIIVLYGRCAQPGTGLRRWP
jgi:hypothetical protein